MYVDLTAWSTRPPQLAGTVRIVLGATPFVASPSDASGRRFEVQVPSDPAASGHLPPGTYDVTVTVGSQDDVAEWHPTVQVPAPDRRGKARIVAAEVELSDAPNIGETLA